MGRTILGIWAAVLAVCLAGCGSVSKERADDLQSQLNSFRKDTEARISENRQDLKRLEEQNRIQKKQLAHIAEENKRLSSENQILAERLRRVEERIGTANSAERGRSDQKRKLKIKVLSGDCNLDSAERMARRLEKLGYKVTSTGMANRCNFKYNTVFFVPEAADAANHLAEVLSGKTVRKSVDWDTNFDLIVVTGLLGED